MRKITFLVASFILMLNATLTVKAGMAGSHQNKGWEKFTDAIIKILSEEKWKSFNEYRSILYDLHKNYTYLINKKTNKIDLNNIDGKKYLIKKQN